MFNINSEMAWQALNMFGFLAVELTLLFLAISYLVGVLQLYIPPQKIQRILSAKNGSGYIVAGFLGAITPFCSCSTIPFLKGLLRARAGFGTMMVFLFASPLLNPIIIGLFAVTFGWKVSVFYFAIAMGVSVVAGYLLEKLGFEKYVKAESYLEPEAKKCGSSCSGKPAVERNKWLKIWDSTWLDFKKVLPYLIGMSGLIYLIGACVLNAVFIYKAVKLKIAGNDETAMDLFRFSIIHLMVLFVVLFIDKWLPLWCD